MAWAAAIPAGLSLVGGLTKSAGQAKGGQAQSQMEMYQSGVALRNANIERMMAEEANQVGQTRAGLVGLRGAGELGTLKARQAASGADVNTGSAVDVRAAKSGANQYDVANTIWEGQKAAYGFQRQAENYEQQSQLDIAAAGGATTAGGLGAFGTLLDTSSQFAGSNFGSSLFGGSSGTTPSLTGVPGGPGIYA